MIIIFLSKIIKKKEKNKTPICNFNYYKDYNESHQP